MNVRLCSCIHAVHKCKSGTIQFGQQRANIKHELTNISLKGSADVNCQAVWRLMFAVGPLSFSLCSNVFIHNTLPTNDNVNVASMSTLWPFCLHLADIVFPEI